MSSPSDELSLTVHAIQRNKIYKHRRIKNNTRNQLKYNSKVFRYILKGKFGVATTGI
jgi:hypothetical protein